MTREVLAEEIRPVVREAITAEVLDAVHDLIGHLPKAITVAAQLLDHPDERIRYDAANLIMRHTAGNKSVVPDVNADAQRDLTVHFNLPRPDGPRQGDADEGTGVIETKQCDSCGEHKPIGPEHFMGQSDRCVECFKRMQGIGQGIVERTGSDG